jgi:hypothetical protein
VEISTANLPVITGIAATTVDTSAVSVSWSGIYTSVNITYSDSVFDASLGDVTTITDISDNLYDISGLNSRRITLK